MYHTSINDKVRAIIEKSDDHGDSLSIKLQYWTLLMIFSISIKQRCYCFSVLNYRDSIFYTKQLDMLHKFNQIRMSLTLNARGYQRNPRVWEFMTAS